MLAGAALRVRCSTTTNPYTGPCHAALANSDSARILRKAPSALLTAAQRGRECRGFTAVLRRGQKTRKLFPGRWTPTKIHQREGNKRRGVRARLASVGADIEMRRRRNGVDGRTKIAPPGEGIGIENKRGEGGRKELVRKRVT
ncbi:hypothetical protein MTO96_015461 [Rhipicephalus appendiculatus]